MVQSAGFEVEGSAREIVRGEGESFIGLRVHKTNKKQWGLGSTRRSALSSEAMISNSSPAAWYVALILSTTYSPPALTVYPLSVID